MELKQITIFNHFEKMKEKLFSNLAYISANQNKPFYISGNLKVEYLA